jgi:hypothetical protein
MKQVFRSKLLKRVLILAFLITSLVFVASSDRTAQTVYAAPCCDTCDAEFDQCRAEATSQEDRMFCIEQNNDCLSWCDMCTGGGGGAGCQTSNECPYRPGYGWGYCVGGNCVY